MFGRKKIYKHCPRCGEKNYINAKVCDNCKLVFSRLQYASNKMAKQAIKRGAKEEVIKTKDLPSDVNKWKLFLLSAVGGLVGAHNFYIGRYFKAIFSLFFFSLTFILLLCFDSGWVAQIYNSILFIPAGLVFIFWLYDTLLIGLSKYKVPVALDMPTAQKADYARKDNNIVTVETDNKQSEKNKNTDETEKEKTNQEKKEEKNEE